MQSYTPKLEWLKQEGINLTDEVGLFSTIPLQVGITFSCFRVRVLFFVFS